MFGAMIACSAIGTARILLSTIVLLYFGARLFASEMREIKISVEGRQRDFLISVRSSSDPHPVVVCCMAALSLRRTQCEAPASNRSLVARALSLCIRMRLQGTGMTAARHTGVVNPVMTLHLSAR